MQPSQQVSFGGHPFNMPFATLHGRNRNVIVSRHSWQALSAIPSSIAFAKIRSDFRRGLSWAMALPTASLMGVSFRRSQVSTLGAAIARFNFYSVATEPSARVAVLRIGRRIGTVLRLQFGARGRWHHRGAAGRTGGARRGGGLRFVRL
jgi:hypothetical protein